MKQINFNHAGGFPLEQETLERIQTAYRSELYDALKRHLSIETGTNYILATPTSEANGWAIIHQYEKNQKDPEESRILQGILYPIVDGTPTDFLKTTRIGTNLIYGTGASKTAYFDYEAAYVSQEEYSSNAESSQNNDELTIYYYDLRSFETVLDLQSIQEIFQSIRNNIYAVEGNINAIENNINTIEADINLINQSYLPINGSKAMEGDLDLGVYQLSKLDTKENAAATVRAVDFKFGHKDKRGKLHGTDYLGRALVDESDETKTNLTLNYASDWQNTSIGGKVYLDNLNTITEDYKGPDSTDNSLLLLNTANQVIKSNNLLSSLLDRITKLEDQKSTAVPIGMIAIWGKPKPFPEGWEEYVPLKGKMPVGQQILTAEEKSDALDGDGGNGISYYRDIYGSAVFPFETLTSSGGRMSKKLGINEIPAHTHTETRVKEGAGTLINFEAVGDDGHLGYESVASGPAGGGLSFPILNPYTVVHFIQYTGRPSDKTPPTPPTLSVSTVGSKDVTLNWTGSFDEYGITDYIIYGNAISPISVGNVFTQTIYGLNPDTPYTFHVVAKDEAGNVSTESNTVSVTTLAIIAPTIPQNVRCFAQGTNAILVQWDHSTNNGGPTIYYEIWRRTSYGTFTKLPTSVINNYYNDTGLIVNTLYTYYIIAKDSDNRSDMSEYASDTTETASCFDVESLVTMASGQSKKLKNVVVGDKLQGLTFPNEIDESEGDYMLWNGLLSESSKVEVTVVNKITSVQPNYYEIKTEDTVIKATGQHPLLITEDGENLRWVCIKNVVQNMLLIDKSGKTKTIESITFKEEPLEVALLDVENVDNYVISGIVAHNNKPLDPPTNP